MHGSFDFTNKDILEQKCAVENENKFLTSQLQLYDKVIFTKSKMHKKITTFGSQLRMADNAHLSKEIDGQGERALDESHGTFPYKNVHTFTILGLISRESSGSVEVHPYSTG